MQPPSTNPVSIDSVGSESRKITCIQPIMHMLRPVDRVEEEQTHCDRFPERNAEQYFSRKDEIEWTLNISNFNLFTKQVSLGWLLFREIWQVVFSGYEPEAAEMLPIIHM